MGIFDIYLPIAGIHFNALILIAIGFSVGVLGGFFGVGGAWIITPALNIFGFNMSYAIGTDLAHIFGKSIVATAKHRKMGNVDMKLGILSIFGSVLGVEAGARMIMWLSALGRTPARPGGYADPVVRYVYMVLLFGLGIYMLYDYLTKDKRAAAQVAKMAAAARGGWVHEPKKGWQLPPMIHFPASGITISFWTVTGVFFFTGWLSGFLGVGGGFIRMPALIYLIGCPTAIAVGTDLFSVLFTGAYGCFTYGLKGRVEVVAAVIMLIGVSVGAQIGVTAVKYIRGFGIRLLFAVMIILAGASVALKQFGFAGLAGWVVLGAALGMCLVIMLRLWKGYQKEKAEKAAILREGV
jgi:uncharacterized protein